MQATVNGIDTRYVFEDRSGGPALTFIHQLGGDLSVWDTLAGHFRHRFRVLRYDVRGHGASAVSNTAFGFKELSADLTALLDAKDIEKTHLVGMSMGGMIAQQFALAHPVAHALRHGEPHRARSTGKLERTRRARAPRGPALTRRRDDGALVHAGLPSHESRYRCAHLRRFITDTCRRLRARLRSPARLRRSRTTPAIARAHARRRGTPR
jgi:pimeloyl-ACP methyl ester carboxylesterase